MDGTETPKGLSSEGQTSEGEQETSQTKTYTEEEHQKGINDALATKGRDFKSLSEEKAAIKAEREAIETEKAKQADWERQREQVELEEARRDPDKLAAWQKRQTEKTRDAEFTKREADLKKSEADFRKREAEHEAEIKSARESRMEMAIFELGAKYEINPTVLKDSAKDLDLTTVEQVEALAKRLSGMQKRPSEAIIPASGVTSGGHGTLTPAQFEKLPQEEKRKYLKM